MFKVCGLALTAALSVAGYSQNTPASPPMNGIAHVAIRVADLSASRMFYQKLGYQEAFALDKGGAPTEAFFKVNDTQFIELYPQHEPSQALGFLHVCFQSKDLEALNTYYQSRGLHPNPVRRAGAGNLLFTMTGPEQQNIEYTQYMPGSRHTLDIGKHLSPDRIADRILSVGIYMQDAKAAAEFYADKMGFIRASGVSDKVARFDIPGSSGQEIEILPKGAANPLHLILGAEDLKRTAKELKHRQIQFENHKGTLIIRDPDGNLIELRH